jgi:hypothetical protein
VKEESKTGSIVSTKVKINVILRVVNIDYDAEAMNLRIGGINVAENRYI